MKKLVCVVLAGAVIMGACACSKKDTPKSARGNGTTVEEEDEDVDEADETTEEEEADETTEFDFEKEYWFVDPTDEATIKKLVDNVIACEPKMNDSDSDIGRKVGTTFDHEYSEYAMMSFGYQFYFEYGSENLTDIINERNHVRYVAYNGFELEDVGHFDFVVRGYKAKDYGNSERPGSGSVSLYVYDEKEANACKDIFVNYIRELYKDEITGEQVFESLNGIYLLYGDKQTDRLAEIWCRPVEDVEGCWQVTAIITFNDADMMPKT